MTIAGDFLRGRCVTGVSDPDLNIRAGGYDPALPVMIGPIGFTSVCRRDADMAAARAATAAGTRRIASTVSSGPIEDIAAAAGQEIGFQLYARQGTIVHSLLNRAEDQGVKSLYVTVDLSVPGLRRARHRHGVSFPPVLTPKLALDMARHPLWAVRALWYKHVSAGKFTGGRGGYVARKSGGDRRGSSPDEPDGAQLG